MHTLRSILLLFISLIALGACSDSRNQTQTEHPQEAYAFEVFKSPTCGCCQKWINHIEQAGLSTQVTELEQLAPIKDKYGIPANLRSCHTAIYNGEYVFEGHIPAKFIQQFIANPVPDSYGLSVPAMPVGSPGMEYQNMFNPYEIRVLKMDGSSEIYAKIRSYQEQF